VARAPLAVAYDLGTLAPQMTPVGVLLVDPDETFRRSARAVVTAAPGFDLVAEAASAEEALEAALPLRPDLVLLAVSMPGIDGLETSRRLLAAVPETVVVLEYDTEEPDPDASKTAGAAASLHREALTPASLQALWEQHGSG
jgi:two-component system chemotaxis response regulator CheB